MRLIDVHCHLGDEAFKDDLKQVLDRASGQGVSAIISSSVTLPEAARSLKISAQYPNFVFTSIGSDPSRLEPDWVVPIRQTVNENRSAIIGIGEVGLDHFWVKEPERRERQLELFNEWILLATEERLPLTVHSRSAGREALKAVASSGVKRVLMHAYDGKVGHAMEAAEMGIFFSIPASVVHSEQKQKLARRIPMENLVLETDAPVLSPSKDQRNEPSNLTYSAHEVAKLKRADIEAVAEITSRNARRLFELPNTP